MKHLRISNQSTTTTVYVAFIDEHDTVDPNLVSIAIDSGSHVVLPPETIVSDQENTHADPI